MNAVLLVLVVLLALVAAFAVQNPGVIVVRFLTYSGYTSLLVVIVAAFAAGVASARARRASRVLPAQVGGRRRRATDPGARGRGRGSQKIRRGDDALRPGKNTVSDRSFSGNERKLLRCLLRFYREIGPGATPALKGLDEETGLERWEISEAVAALRAKGLIEYWELQPAVRLTPEGLRTVLRLPEEGDA